LIPFIVGDVLTATGTEKGSTYANVNFYDAIVNISSISNQTSVKTLTTYSSIYWDSVY
jgi:hypothetical protein